ncbi:MAG: hypothetical protein FWH01_07525 [Oscillospiraceae bacterium]|nr:hypothetical protein [Oscillospiraceae bacterium]
MLNNIGRGFRDNKGSKSSKGSKRSKSVKSRKKTLIKVLSIVGAVVIVAGIIVAAQWENINAIRYMVSFTEDEITEKIDENDRKITDIMSDAISVRIRDLTEDEKKSLATDVITVEQAVRLLVDDTKYNHDGTGGAGSAGGSNGSNGSNSAGSATDGASSTTRSSGNTGAGGAENTEDTVEIEDIEDIEDLGDETTNQMPTNGQYPGEGEDEETELTRLVAEAVVLRAYYTNRLEAMRVSALSEYSSLDKEEQTQTAKMNIGVKYLNLAGALEGECDNKMDNLIARIESELRQTGGDTSIVNEIRECYAEDKRLKKAYYLNMYS